MAGTALEFTEAGHKAWKHGQVWLRSAARGTKSQRKRERARHDDRQEAVNDQEQ
jgi:hypothetical protein